MGADVADTLGSIVDEPVRGFVPGVDFLSLPGIERLRSLMDGRIPLAPVQHLTGARLTQVGHGSCTVVMPASPGSRLLLPPPRGERYTNTPGRCEMSVRRFAPLHP